MHRETIGRSTGDQRDIITSLVTASCRSAVVSSGHASASDGHRSTQLVTAWARAGSRARVGLRVRVDEGEGEGEREGEG
jgi:hypothetical protein